jgi:hypothetical protein
MSSTRRAKDDSVYHQSRYASSPEFERGLSAKMVAKRVSVLREKPDRELIWFLHYLSHLEDGLAAVAAQLIEKYSDRFGTSTMLQSGKSGSGKFSADEVLKIRVEIPKELGRQFPLKGEKRTEIIKSFGSDFERQAERNRREAEAVRWIREQEAILEGNAPPRAECHHKEDSDDEKIASTHPVTYTVESFSKLCLEAAARKDSANMTVLERALFDLCLNPAVKLDAGCPWYFVGMADALRQMCERWTAAKVASTVVTSLGKRMYGALDYTRHSRRLSLSIGAARTGKTFSARAWCQQRPGQARFVEVPPGNDDSGFYRALARGIGLGNFSQYNSVDLRERVESVLLAGDLVLVLDESQRLWPQRNFREGFPMRIEWVMAMVNASVPIALVSSPEFFTKLTIAKKNADKSGWNPAQFVGRIGRYNPLPTKIAESDLVTVARAVLPEASENALKALALYAKKSARYLAAIESIAADARYRAEQEGRQSPSSRDIRNAMEESVIPSDSNLLKTLEKMKTSHKRSAAAFTAEAMNLESQDHEFPPRPPGPDVCGGKPSDVPAMCGVRPVIQSEDEGAVNADATL